nr:hypothetical protein [Candidatus Sigynarchaeota archaeon]
MIIARIVDWLKNDHKIHLIERSETRLIVEAGTSVSTNAWALPIMLLVMGIPLLFLALLVIPPSNDQGLLIYTCIIMVSLAVFMIWYILRRYAMVTIFFADKPNGEVFILREYVRDTQSIVVASKIGSITGLSLEHHPRYKQSPAHDTLFIHFSDRHAFKLCDLPDEPVDRLKKALETFLGIQGGPGDRT